MVLIKKDNSNGKHYLYLHTRIDVNEVFYVGVGTKYYPTDKYTRARQKGRYRSGLWNKIANKSDYTITILFENDDYQIIKNKEIELISNFGKLCDNTGTLTNFTNGGDGKLGYRDENKIKSVYLYTKDGEFFKEFKAHSDCAKFLKVLRSSLSLSVNKHHLIKGFIIKSYKKKKVSPIDNLKEKLSKRLSKPLKQISRDGSLIKIWKSSSEASKKLKISGGHIREVCAKKRKTAGNYIWEYVN